MHPEVFEQFDRICRERHAGGDVLEIGAVPSPESLLTLPALKQARRKLGVNLTASAACADFEIIAANANDLGCFSDASFDTVLCNAVLEHDPYFWRTLAEIRRVLRPGGLMVIGVPGFEKLAGERWLARAARLPLFGALLRRWFPALLASTATLQVHLYPGDYYRFSVQAAREVFLEGLGATEVVTLLVPPRIIAVGVKR